MRRVEVCSLCLGFVVTSTSGGEGCPIMMKRSWMFPLRSSGRILLVPQGSSQPASVHADRFPGLHGLTFLEAQDQRIAGQLGTQQPGLTACTDSVHRRLEFRGKCGGCFASSFEGRLLRSPISR